MAFLLYITPLLGCMIGLPIYLCAGNKGIIGYVHSLRGYCDGPNNNIPSIVMIIFCIVKCRD